MPQVRVDLEETDDKAVFLEQCGFRFCRKHQRFEKSVKEEDVNILVSWLAQCKVEASSNGS